MGSDPSDLRVECRSGAYTRHRQGIPGCNPGDGLRASFKLKEKRVKFLDVVGVVVGALWCVCVKTRPFADFLVTSPLLLLLSSNPQAFRFMT
jgi:hypothetical protein